MKRIATALVAASMLAAPASANPMPHEISNCLMTYTMPIIMEAHAENAAKGGEDAKSSEWAMLVVPFVVPTLIKPFLDEIAIDMHRSATFEEFLTRRDAAEKSPSNISDREQAKFDRALLSCFNYAHGIEETAEVAQ